MSIKDALKFISDISGKSVTTTGTASPSYNRGSIGLASVFDRANKIALDAVADFGVAEVKTLLSRDYYTHGPAGPNESPSSRTGTLKDSIHWKAGRSSRQFPGPFPDGMKKTDLKRFSRKERIQYNWYQRIKNHAYENNSLITPYPASPRSSSNIRIIEVDPGAADRSSRQRLEYYSYYLETGWHSGRNEFHKDTGKSSSHRTTSPKKPSKNSHGDGSGWNPARPFLMKLARPEYQAQMQAIYQSALARELPEPYKKLAFRCKLTVSYNHSLRVPYLSDNKNNLD